MIIKEKPLFTKCLIQPSKISSENTIQKKQEPEPVMQESGRRAKEPVAKENKK